MWAAISAGDSSSDSVLSGRTLAIAKLYVVYWCAELRRMFGLVRVCKACE